MADEKIFQARSTLRRMAKANLLKMAFCQKEKNCVLGGYVLFFCSTNASFFVSLKSSDRDAN
jgi:hypothetical protein